MNTFIIILHGKDTQLLPNYQIILQKQYATKKGANSFCLRPYFFIFFKNRFACYQFAISEINLIRTKRTSSSV